MKELLKPGDRVIDFQWTADTKIPEQFRTIKSTGTVTQVNPLRIRFDPTPGHDDVGDLDWNCWRKDVCTSVIGHIGSPCKFCGWEIQRPSHLGNDKDRRIQEVG